MTLMRPRPPLTASILNGEVGVARWSAIVDGASRPVSGVGAVATEPIDRCTASSDASASGVAFEVVPCRSASVAALKREAVARLDVCDASSAAASRCAGIEAGDALDVPGAGALATDSDPTGVRIEADATSLDGVGAGESTRAARTAGAADRPRRDVAPTRVSTSRCAAGVADLRVELATFVRMAGAAGDASCVAIARIGMDGVGATGSVERNARGGDVTPVLGTPDATRSAVRDRAASIPCVEVARCTAAAGWVRATAARANCVLCVATEDGIARDGDVVALLERRVTPTVGRGASTMRCTAGAAALRDAAPFRDGRTARCNGGA